MDLIKKLNYKDQKEVLLYNLPEKFSTPSNLKNLFPAKTKIIYDENEVKNLPFFLGFAKEIKEVEKIAEKIIPVLQEAAIFWIAYPKKSSKKYKSEINRDQGFSALGKRNYEPVKIVALDEDWSALRFKRVELIKNFTRNAKMVLSQAGKKRLKKTD